MCKKNMRFLNRTLNGLLKQCNSCKKYNIEFNNIFLELTKRELNNFKNYVNGTDFEYWENEYGMFNKRSIPVPTAQNNLMLVFNIEEFNELKRLLNFEEKIDYKPLLYTEIKDNICFN